MSAHAKPVRHAKTAPDLKVVAEPAKPSAQAARPASAPPQNTTADAWAHVHPARVWPD